MMANYKVVAATMGVVMGQLSLNSFAQNSPQAYEIYLNEWRAADAIKRNTVSSENDKDVVPISAYYEVVFREIQQSPPDFISDEDWRVIQDLPSHRDMQFRKQEVETVDSVCASIGSAVSKSQIVELSSTFDSANSNLASMLSSHYKNVLKKLSFATQEYIERRVAEFSSSNVVGYISIRMAGVAEEMPEMAKTIIERGCAVVREQGGLGELRTLKLVDEGDALIPMRN